MRLKWGLLIQMKIIISSLNFKGTESEFSRSSAPSSKESKKTAKEKGKEKGKGDEPMMDEGFKKGFKPDESSFLPEIKTGIDEYISAPLHCFWSL